jgi:hypothetical protein
MQEKHPIDDLFRAALHDAEVSPPERVHTALADRMGWGTRTTGAGTPPFLLVGIVGVALALVSWYTSGTKAQQAGVVQLAGTTSPVQPSTAADHEDLAGATQAAFGNSTTSDHLDQGAFSAKAEASTETPPALRTTTSTVSSTASDRAPSSVPAEARTSAAPVADGAHGARTDRTDESDGAAPSDSSPGSLALSSPPAVRTADHPVEGGTSQGTGTAGADLWSTDENIGQALASTPSEATFELSLQRLSPIVRSTDVKTPQPLPANIPATYLLARGEWWWSMGIGLSRPHATWSGEGAETLARSEQWRRGQQLGLGVGRSWRNGFGVGLGVAIERLLSDFQHEEHRPGATYTEVDTTWLTLNYPDTNVPIAIWWIDSTTVMGPGSWERTNARNTYTVLQLPLTGWWHTDMRRWSFGVMAGAVCHIPMPREGHTLARNGSDGTWQVASLNDGSTRDRFRPQLHGHAGLSLGYLVSDHLRILVEPGYSTSLLPPRGVPSLSLSRTFLQIRLQHALHCR